MCHLRTFTLLAAGTALAWPVPVSAQPPHHYGLAAGLVIPQGDYDALRSPGPVVRGTITWGAPARHVYLRGELESAWLLAHPDRTTRHATDQDGTILALSAMLSYVVGTKNPRFAVYVYPAIGAQYVATNGVPGHTFAPGVRAGAGVRGRVGQYALHLELARHLALTDIGTGRDFGRAAYMPIVVGVTF